MYMTVKQAVEKWGISDRCIRILCVDKKNVSKETCISEGSKDGGKSKY